MSHQDDQTRECPLCMEPFEMDDFNFFPCTCGYQICRFCWHRIRTDENGLCPACRKQYPEDPADFKPLSVEEWQKIKTEKRQKDQQKKQKMSESRKHLANVRVVQKNLVFVVGLPARLAEVEVLKKLDYFGKFGKIHKVVVNQTTTYAGSLGPSASAYVTYCKPEDALRAIKSVNNVQVDGRILKASLGTTKYCSHFLKNLSCPKTDCMYLHELGDEAASFTKEDMQQGKHQEYEKRLQDQIFGTNRKAASPIPTQDSTNCWPCAVLNLKESRSKKSKDSSKNQESEGKSNRSKKSEGQKSKKGKNKSNSDSSMHNSQSKQNAKEDNSRKNQKGKHREAKESSSGSSSSGRPSDESEVELNVQQTTFVHIAESSPTPKVVSASIKIAHRSESPVLPPSPVSSSSSSLFTPFGSLSSNFMSSSSPSPPPSNGNSLSSFPSLGCSSSQEEQASPVESYALPLSTEHKPDSPSPLFGNGDCNDSLFSNMGYQYENPMQTDMGSYRAPVQEDSSEDKWADEMPKQIPEDDLDFDPWNESSKGLADLIAKEAVVNRSYSEMPTPPGFFQPIKAPVPNQQRVGIPPPGFCSRQVPQTNSINHFSGMYGQSNTDYMPKTMPARQNNLHCEDYYFQDQRQNLQDINSQYKQQYLQQNRDNTIENLRFKKNIEDRFRNLIPDMFYHFNSTRNVPKSQSQNGPSWNPQQRDISWLSNETAMLNSEGPRSNTHLWMKALQQLQIEENNTNHFNGHSSFGTNPFALRGQWPTTAQCPPPGFVAPSRSSVNTPFQHMQVNQKI